MSDDQRLSDEFAKSLREEKERGITIETITAVYNDLPQSEEYQLEDQKIANEAMQDEVNAKAP